MTDIIWFIHRLPKAEIPATVNSDDPLLINSNLEQEYKVLMDCFGYGKQDLIRIARNAFERAVCSEEVLNQFDAFVDKEN